MTSRNGQNGRWAWARDFTRVSPQSVTLLLVVGMLLYFQDRGIQRITYAMDKIVVVMERVEGALLSLSDATHSEQKFRQHEHDELAKALEECREMGHELADCQRRSP